VKSTATATRWNVETLGRNIHRINLNVERVGDEQRVLLMSDVHWDNPHCDRDLLKRHLDEAVKHEAPILDAGDWHCAMQGRFDNRSSKNDLRPEHQRGDYLDALVRTSAEWLRPYQHLLTVRGFGNHETGILKRHETHLTERLVERLKTQGAEHVVMGGYSGYVVFNVTYSGTCKKAFKMHYHHGAGGGGPVTRGVIQTNRQAVYLADADIVWNGHTHDAWNVPISRVRLNPSCTEVEHVRQVHVRTAGYKQEYGDGYGGWHIERWGPPKPLGAAWLVFKHLPGKVIDFDVIEAK
jgi:hypothetical protein